MYFSEIYSIFFLDTFFHFLYLFKMWEIFMPHPVSDNEIYLLIKYIKSVLWRVVKRLS